MKIKKWKAIIFVIPVLLILAVIAFVSLRDRLPVEKALLKMLPSEIDLRVKDVVYTEIGSNGVKWEVRADSAKYLKNQKLALFDNVNIRFIMTDGRVFTLTGREGKLNTESRDIEIKGDIVIVSSNGDRFMTDQLLFSKRTELVSTDMPIIMENRHMRIEAVGMTLSLKDEHLSLKSGIKATVN